MKINIISHDLVSLSIKPIKYQLLWISWKKPVINPTRYNSNKYKDDGFEFLVELFIKSHTYSHINKYLSMIPVPYLDKDYKES